MGDLTSVEDLQWVYDHMGDGEDLFNKAAKDAPSHGTWAYCEACRQTAKLKADFYGAYMAMVAKDQERRRKREEQFQDEGIALDQLLVRIEEEGKVAREKYGG